jgi:molecular chaperone DnaK
LQNKVLGIDLGTSNCCLAYFENGQARVLVDERGNRYTPSYLTILENQKYLIGHLAKVQVISNPYQTAYAVKRLMGRKVNDPKINEMKKIVGYEIVSGPEENAYVKLAEKILSPVEISAVYLQGMRDIAHHQLESDDVNDAVITVPAYFNDAQRQATKEAGEKAGLNVLRLINEPTAAALAYGYNRDMDKRIAIFDLGGGTFDISVLEISGGIFEVIGTHGDSFLGGHDFDGRILELILADFKKKHGIGLESDKMALQRVKDACENAKCELSNAERAQVNLPFIARSGGESINLIQEVTRKQLQDLTQDLVKRTIDICAKVLHECGMSTEDIDDVILVGGQTRMPMVQKAVQDFFKKAPVKGVHPDEAVAIGAAIEGSILGNKSQDVLLLDVTPLSLGIQSAGDMFTKIVAKNSKVPISFSKIFTTTQDEQKRVKICVLQGESKLASENTALGDFILEGIRDAPRMEPKIKVTFRIDANGILNVKAMDMDTQTAQQITVTNHSDKKGLPKGKARAKEDSSLAKLLDQPSELESLEVALKE